MQHARLLAVWLIVGLAASPGLAATITFDEFPATNNNAPVTNAYAGLGVLFDGDNSGTFGGLSAGDPGNWDLEGTNGPAFLGNNGLNNASTYVSTIHFTSGTGFVSFDVSRSTGSADGQTLTASVFNGATLLGTTVLTLGPINTWTTLSFTAVGIDRLVLDGSQTGFSPYGVDNLVFDHAPVPEPTTLLLVGSGVLGGLVRSRRRQTRDSCPPGPHLTSVRPGR
jgi:hypothetical protein